MRLTLLFASACALFGVACGAPELDPTEDTSTALTVGGVSDPGSGCQYPTKGCDACIPIANTLKGTQTCYTCNVKRTQSCTPAPVWNGHVWIYSDVGAFSNNAFELNLQFQQEAGVWKMYIRDVELNLLDTTFKLPAGQVAVGTVQGNDVSLTLPITGRVQIGPNALDDDDFMNIDATLQLSTTNTITPFQPNGGVAPPLSGGHWGTLVSMVGAGKIKGGANTLQAMIQGDMPVFPR